MTVADGGFAPVAVGHHLFSPGSDALRDEWRYGLTTTDLWREFLRPVGSLVLQTLASKDLVERLDPGDAAMLELDIDRLGHTQLSELTTATDKARRDAPAIAVCEV